ncbi:MAG: hypothetical protein ACRDOK_17630 [Streptosporangiaceae bacterium]
MTSSHAYRYGQTIGEFAYLDAVNQDGKTAAFAPCQEEAGGITSSFIPAVALVDSPQWKNSEAKGHMGCFLGVKEGCKVST